MEPDDHTVSLLENRSAPEILYWAAKTFPGRLAITSSFQTQSLPLLHLVSRICPSAPVLFLDTGFHFEETLKYRDLLIRILGLNVRILHPLTSRSELLAKHGELYRKNANMCCYLNKVEPLERTLQSFDAWVSGIRRDQTAVRGGVKVLDKQANGLYKICPMLDWTDKMVNSYCEKSDLPPHPLLARGYKSIGCIPCTRAVQDGEDPRAGRWSGTKKTECGLHYNLENYKK